MKKAIITVGNYTEFRNLIKWYEELKAEGLTQAKACATVFANYLETEQSKKPDAPSGQQTGDCAEGGGRST